MTDLERILPLWHELRSSGADYVLATVVAVEGPSYRKPGARMLIAQDGRRAGTISGGCLEAEVARRAWWLTASGPVVERYSTVADDGDMPYGSGCGGVVYILLERPATAAQLLTALETAWTQRTPLAIATVLEGRHAGQRAFASPLGVGNHELHPATLQITKIEGAPSIRRPLGEWVGDHEPQPSAFHGQLQSLADTAFAHRTSMERKISLDETPTHIWIDYRPARPGLWIFGAGDDARPLVNLARELGWFVAVADGRSHLATPERFPSADAVTSLPISELPGPAWDRIHLRPSDAAVVMTHSYEQDSHILASLLSASHSNPLAYLGVLGPQRRTRDLLADAARMLNLSRPTDRAEQWLAQLHAPTGIDLGAETPASVALSILAEIQQSLAAATGQPLRHVRAIKLELTQS